MDDSEKPRSVHWTEEATCEASEWNGSSLSALVFAIPVAELQQVTIEDSERLDSAVWTGRLTMSTTIDAAGDERDSEAGDEP